MLPVSVFVVGSLFVARAVRYGKLGIAWPPGLGEAAVIAYIVANSLALLIGGLLTGFNAAQFGYWAQSLAPFTAYLVGQSLVRGSTNRLEALRHFTLAAATAGVLLGAILAVATLTVGADTATGIVDSLGPFGLSKAKRFIPTVIAACVGLQLLRRRERFRGVELGLLSLAVLSILLAHSRFAAGALLVVMAVYFVGRREALTTRRMATLQLSLGLTILIIFGFGVSGMKVPLLDEVDLRAYERLTRPGESEALSTANRADAAASGLREGLSSPLGRAFSLEVEQSTGGYELGRERVANSENGFTEVALRSGPLSFLALLTWLVSESRGRVRLSRCNRDYFAVNVVLAVFFIGGAWVQNAFTELYSATFFFALVGASSPRLHKRSLRRENHLRMNRASFGEARPGGE